VISAPKQLWRWRKAASYLVKNWLKGTPDTDVTAQIADLMLPGALSPAASRCSAWAATSRTGAVPAQRASGHRLEAQGLDAYFERLRTTSRDFAERARRSLRGQSAVVPARVITVHPLGGAPMGAPRTRAWWIAYGNVFGHPGLHVADGSVMPGPTGPNPSFTIAALADRFADQIIDPDRRAAEAAAS
jgi:cholesterol oxidase